MTFLVMHLTGLLGMPRRFHTYPEGFGWETWNLISSLGGFLTTMGFALFAVDMLMQFRFGRIAPRNPWNAGTLDWAMATPPTNYAYASLPEVHGRTPLADDPELGAELAAGRGYLGFVRNGWQETLVVEMATGKPQQIAILPQPTFLPLVTAITTGAVVLSLLFKLYWLALAALALTVALLLSWSRATGHREDRGPLPVGCETSLPVHYEAERPPSWWAMVFTLVANGMLFSSLGFGALFLWLVAPDWPPPQLLQGIGLKAAAATAGLILAAFAGHRAVRANASESRGRDAWLLAAALGHALSLGSLAAILMLDAPDPTTHAYAAVTAALLFYPAVHCGVGILFALFGLYRSRAGFVSAARGADLRIGLLWHDYTALTGIVALLLVGALPLLVGLDGFRP